MPGLSAVIVAQDEERTIGRVLAAIKDLVDEIVFVDSGSSDRTKDIALEYSAKLVHQDWLGYAAQKNFAIDLASQEWILSLDADEIITPELAAEIKSVLSGVSSYGTQLQEYDGFKISRLMFVGDRAIAHGGFYPDAQLRLFRRGKGRFNTRLVHESVQVAGKVGKLKHHLLHLSYRDIEHFRSTLDKYARLAAQESLRSGFKPAKLSVLNLWLHPLWTFYYRYVVRAGFLDGSLGLQMNLVYCDYVRKKILYLREAVNAAK